MNRHPERLSDLLPGVLADLARRHQPPTLTNRSDTMIRVHFNPQISLETRDFPAGRAWKLVDGKLHILDEDQQSLAMFQQVALTCIELVDDGAA